MTMLSEIADIPLAIDLRLNFEAAAQLRAPAAAFSLWPEAPFGASADFGVWPSVFIARARVEGVAPSDRIVLEPGEALFWEAFYMWDDVRELTAHLRPLQVGSHVIALALDPEGAERLESDLPLAMLAQNGLSEETLTMDAAFLGYDITDMYLQSALFNAARPEMEPPATQRTEFGLVATLEAARNLRDVLVKDDPAPAPLVCVSVWSLGEREPTRPG